MNGGLTVMEMERRKRLKSNLVALAAWIDAEIDREVSRLKDISGPTGMRNSQASALGLARNSVRQEFRERIAAILEPR